MTYSHGDYLDDLRAERDALREENERLRAALTRREMTADVIGVPRLCDDPGCTLCAPFR